MAHQMEEVMSLTNGSAASRARQLANVYVDRY
eukprot:CAMPEP_0202907528 /NCGR_PEP_ID=MMETSP1392-20130828/42931_1 /ASSEMBLY_ACC=CAM_ASM_000868 /TAXON_ID=225041 /ORGANISM="Chlamydomonas chlamydogama, Strain SAG 11-48b" /LENGTH=31 /DNA_ID= /DNA_START= /DNA_END= /DNA_ORIENTATION=